MADSMFSDDGLAELYDVQHPWDVRRDLAFHLRRVMSARAVLDVGCGTGALLHRARDAGHTGRLCGLDPAPGMLRQARRRTDIEWILGDLGTVGFDREFDLVVMTGHVFQVFITDDELRAALSAVRSALTDDGRFAFETRNPATRTWERLTPDNVLEITDARGRPVRIWREVELPVEGDVVRFATTFAGPGRDGPRVSRSTLRFPDAGTVAAFLSGAGLAIEEQFGDWDENPLTDAGPEIITIARR